jgi:lipopolysaccharide transport system permease protein
MQPPELPVTVYTSDSALRNPMRLLLQMAADLRAATSIALQLAVRDLRAQYRQAALGIAWAFVLPVANSAVWLFIQGTGIVRVEQTDIPYAAYVISGTILWSIFMDAVNAPLQQTLAARPILAKINFPREALVLSGILQTLFNACIKTVVLLVALVLLGVNITSQGVLFPIAGLSLVLVGTAIGLLLTPIGVLYSDVGKGLPVLLQFLMYTAPVVFPVPDSGPAATLLRLNPLTPLIEIARNLLTGQAVEQWLAFVLVNVVVGVLLVILWMTYRVAMPILIERMGT